MEAAPRLSIHHSWLNFTDSSRLEESPCYCTERILCRTLPSAASGKNYVRRFPSQDKKRLQHALISDSDGRSLQGMLDGFEANGIKYYNKYATLKELMGRCWSAATTGSFIFWASGLRRLLGCEGICHHDRLDRWRCGFGFGLELTGLGAAAHGRTVILFSWTMVRAL